MVMKYGQLYSKGGFYRAQSRLATQFKRRRPPNAAPTKGAPLRRRGYRSRAARSYTRTATKRKSPGGAGVIGDQSVSSTRLGRRWQSRVAKMLFKRVLGKQTYGYNSSTSKISNQGQQATWYYQIFRRNDLNTMATTVNVANGGTGFPDKPVKLFLQYGKLRVTLRNQSNVPVTLWIYDIDYNNTTPGTGYDDPTEIWDKGFTDYGFTGTAQRLIPNNKPFGSPEFRQLCRVRRVRMLCLAPGQQHVHTLYKVLNRVVDTTRFSNWTADTIGQMTAATMFVWLGGLGHESATATNVTYCPARLDFVADFEMKWGYLEKTQTQFVHTNNIPAVTNVDMIGDNSVVDVDPVDP